ncbi:ATP-binding protein [Humibacillus xanthopallidus]|uniref:ATP-binding protein n=1 Tax=Humibacillus xanthopallidus TaxID=412689 RepID=UPI00384DAB0F
MAAASGGSVSMVFTDIESSTQLLLSLRERYVEALELHRRVLRRAWTAYEGKEMGTEGDSFFVVFDDPSAAVHACLQAQRELATQEWPARRPVRVRMGVHTGNPMPHGDGFVGADVDLAARVSAAAHGGQIVLTRASFEPVAPLPEVRGRGTDLGWHRLRGFPDPVHLYQLSVPGQKSQFPPLKTLGARASLPVDAGPLLGRDADLEALAALISEPLTCLTLTGPGGVGKTRLAVALAARVSIEFPDGVFFLPLATVATADGLWRGLIEALGVPGEPTTRSGFLERLAQQRALVVLDNLEQIVDGPEAVSGLLAGAPSLGVIATSRRRLHVRGEREYVVAPLGVPAGDDAETLNASPAVELFCQHARTARAGFTLTDENASDVAEICRRLDGLPLAIEIVARRSRVMSSGVLLRQVTDALDVVDPLVGRPLRQQTLRRAVGWSYDLLTPREQATFRCLAVLVAGGSVEACSAVAGVDDPQDVFADVESLVEASLVLVDDDALGEPRVHMLQTVRAFAGSLLEGSGEADGARRRQAEYLLRLATDFWSSRGTPDTPAKRQRLQMESANLRATLAWALDPASATRSAQDARLGVRLAAHLGSFWFGIGAFAEGRAWLLRALDVDTGEPTPERAALLCSASEFLGPADDQRRPALEEAVAISCALGDPRLESEALAALARQATDAHEFDRADQLARESATLASAHRDWNRLWGALQAETFLELERGDYSKALAVLTRARTVAGNAGNELGFIVAEAWSVMCLAYLDRVAEATDRLVDMVRAAPAVEQPLWMLNVLCAGAHVCALLHDHARAARLAGAYWAALKRAGDVLDADAEEEWLRETSLATARTALGSQRWAAAAAEGERLTTTDALAEAALAGTGDAGRHGRT